MEKKANKQLHKGSLYHCLDTKNTFFAISGNILDRYSSAVGWQSTSQGEVFNDYGNNLATGSLSHAENYKTQATGQFSHAEGDMTIASGKGAHAEGGGCQATNEYSHAEGYKTVASGTASHAEGEYTVASKKGAHAEGGSCQATEEYSHAEGCSTDNGASKTVASGKGSHAEGQATKASGKGSHSEGQQSQAITDGSHAEGYKTIAGGKANFNENGEIQDDIESNSNNIGTHAEGNGSMAYGKGSHAEGYQTLAQGNYSHAEGYQSNVGGVSAHAEGYNTRATGDASHSEGNSTIAYGSDAHAEGFESMAGAKKILNEDKVSFTISYNPSSNGAHAEGIQTTAFASGSHAEGMLTLANGLYGHAEGNGTSAFGQHSHAEGYNTVAKGDNSHAEGYSALANESGSHAEGGYTSADHSCSHAEGFQTATGSNCQHVQGKFNISMHTGNYAHVVGNGTEEKRSNAHTLDWQGNAWFAGEVKVGGTSYEDAINLRDPDWSHLKWYILGDSLTIPGGGVDKYAHTNKFYYEYIQEKTHIQFLEIDGVGGTGYFAGSSFDQNFYFRISQNMEVLKTADIITILGSVNDILHSSQADYQPVMEHTLATLINYCPGVPIVVIPPPLCEDFEKTSDAWKNYCNTLEEAAFKNHCRYVEDMYKCPPFDPRIETHKAKFFNNDDGTHPNEVGHQAIASYVYNAMRTALAFE